jgi:hypothetical protein
MDYEAVKKAIELARVEKAAEDARKTKMASGLKIRLNLANDIILYTRKVTFNYIS